MTSRSKWARSIAQLVKHGHRIGDATPHGIRPWLVRLVACRAAIIDVDHADSTAGSGSARLTRARRRRLIEKATQARTTGDAVTLPCASGSVDGRLRRDGAVLARRGSRRFAVADRLALSRAASRLRRVGEPDRDVSPRFDVDTSGRVVEAGRRAALVGCGLHGRICIPGRNGAPKWPSRDFDGPM